ncbi:amino acid permease [Sulfobacillus thermotolerans]|uniref:Amino acid permease n=1 Tax=Sulfobacillus thermotolerans TaxID=338644 RepID=A0ABN5H007_9FIRM|nr:amino acid permease [Sulfobacillus thermotolerans]
MISVQPLGKKPVLLSLSDLSGLSIASVAPLFSVAAAGSIMLSLAGADIIWAVLAIATPFILSSWLFRMLNQHYPNTGASYHWSRRILGFGISRYQSWILMMAYFWSIPPIIIPAAEESLALVGVTAPPSWLVIIVSGAWIGLSAGLLLRGSKTVAQLTKIFMVLEFIAIIIFAIGGVLHWRTLPGNHVTPSWHGFVIAMVVGATIVDGWEIDSYAAEEADYPQKTPGMGGVVGAFMVLAFYLTIFPLMLHSVSLAQLVKNPDVLITWAQALSPHQFRWAIVPIVASTAGSLWLTTFILSKALYAMARDRILPRFFVMKNSAQSPTWTIVVPLVLGWTIVSLQLLVASLASVFNLVLSTAGFFLILEFLFDSLSAAVFLTRIHHHGLHGITHQHRGLQIISYVTTTWFAVVISIFLIYGPAAIGRSIDALVAIMLAGGIIFTFWRFEGRWRGYHVFNPETRELTIEDGEDL